MVFAFVTGSAFADEPARTSAGDSPVGRPAWLDNKTTVDFNGTPLAAALSLLARKNEFNIVAPPLEGQTVTAHLKNVTVAEAPDAVLKVAGYFYYTDDDIVVVRSLADEAPGELPRQGRNRKQHYRYQRFQSAS